MILTDTHTHLYSESFDEDQDEMMQRAMAVGVNRFFVPAIDSSYSEAMLRLEEKYPQNVFLMTGLHPTHVKENVEEELQHVAQLLSERKFYAIGEIGIDLYWDATFLAQQQNAFRQQIKWAKEYNLPIVIHCRNAFDEVFEILEEEADDSLFGIFHCFTGNIQQAKRAIGLNMKLGIGGVVTFKNGKIDQFLSEVPLSEIVLETDAPYLAPTPHRGKRNESAYLPLIAGKLAEIYNMPVGVIAKVTTQNSKDVFGV